MSAKLGDLLSAQVERSKSKETVVVQFAATVPGDGSQVSLDWWLRQMNGAFAAYQVPIELEFADVDKPGRMVSNSDAIRNAQLSRRIEELQAYIDDLEENMRDKAAQMAEQLVSRGEAVLSPKESARRSVEQDGYFVDERGAKWVDIATEAKRIGNKYINLWRAVKGLSPHSIESMVVGSTQANGDRILVKQGSFAAGKRRKRGSK